VKLLIVAICDTLTYYWSKDAKILMMLYHLKN
jgi:hypothetical protein